MNSKRTEARRGPGSGVIVLADLTGYSGYLRDSELAHAQETLASLLKLLVHGTRPPLTVSKLEGDAVLSYGWDDQIQGGQAFAEMIEAIYVAFRRALNQMVLNTTCECNACANISMLDLKFFVHHGDFTIISVAGYDELQGSDVNVVHRLLKNKVTASTGVLAYALYTDAAIAALGLEGLTSSMIPHLESVADVGDVSVWVLDLAPVWERWRDRSLFEIDESEYLLTVETQIPLPAEVVWAYMLDTEYRRALIGSDRQVIDGAKNGRVSEDTVYVCYHGDRVLTQVVLEIVPFERLLTRDLVPVPGDSTYALLELVLERTDDGVRLLQRFARPEGPWWGRLAGRLSLRTLHGKFQRDVDRFRDLVLEAERERAGAAWPPRSHDEGTFD